MKVLGLSAFYHDAAAALVVDGRVVAAVQEERLSRVKHDAAFPQRAVAACLAEAGLGPADLDLVAWYEKPLLKLERLLETHLAVAPRSLPAFVRALPGWLRSKVHVGRAVARGLPGYARRCVYAEHHLAHAASAFLPSPFPRAAVLTVDGVGEWATATLGRGAGAQVELLEDLRFPHSLGLLYSAFTVLCGFAVNDGEYKLMGLAPYGEPRFERLIRERLIDLKEDGSFRLDQRWFGWTHALATTTPRLHRLLGRPPRRPDEPLEQHHLDLAASVQRVTEEVLLRAARHLARRTGERDLCLAGGVALNAVANGRLRREGPFERVWVQPAAGDAGGALGAALWAAHTLLEEPRPTGDASPGTRLGPSAAPQEVRALLARRGLAHEHHADEGDLVERVAGLLAEGRVVGWFHGRLEWGPRALGGRSILADPRDPAMQSRVNRSVKFREGFRPFAPAVAAEEAHRWFDVPPGHASPAMLFVERVHPDRRLPAPAVEPAGLARLKVPRSTIPAVTHVDGSARLQTVEASAEPRFHRLLTAFGRRTGCPVLVNTSFNVKDEPIVATPEDALDCFERTAIDALVLEDCLVLAPPGRAPRAGAPPPAPAGSDAVEGSLPEAPPAALPPAYAPLLPPAALGLAALIGWLAGAGTTAVLALLGAGLLGGTLLALVPRWRAPALAAWGRLTRPLARAVSAALLTTVYLLLVTPLGLLARLCGHDPLERRLERARASYWRPRPASEGDPEAPFRRW